MNILLTGATGFVGTHLRKKLADKYNVTVVVRPSTETSELIDEGLNVVVYDGNPIRLGEELAQRKINGVIHLASLYLKQHAAADIEGLINSNVLFPTELLEACAAANVNWFINTGTFWQHYENHDYSPVNLYAATKQAFIDIAKYYQETSNVKFITLKLSETFGPGDTRPKIFNIWHKIAETGEEMKMSGGEQLMDISFIDDVTGAFMKLTDMVQTNTGKLGDEYAVTSGRRLTLKELAGIFEQETGTRLNIEWGALPYREREVMSPWKNGMPVTGWMPETSLEEGIRLTFKKNHD